MELRRWNRRKSNWFRSWPASSMLLSLLASPSSRQVTDSLDPCRNAMLKQSPIEEGRKLSGRGEDGSRALLHRVMLASTLSNLSQRHWPCLHCGITAFPTELRTVMLRQLPRCCRSLAKPLFYVGPIHSSWRAHTWNWPPDWRNILCMGNTCQGKYTALLPYFP